MTTSHPAPRRALAPASRRALALASAALLLLESAVLAVILATRDPLVLPVTVDLPGSPPRADLARLDVGVAVVVLCVLTAAFRLVALRHPNRDLRWVEYSLTASITVFLVARSNGIEDLGALVLVYAATSAMVLFTMLQDRSDVRRGHPMLPLCFGAAVGIVPWGVIAFHQAGAGIVGEGVPVVVRIVTLVMLSFAFLFAVTQWRDLRQETSAAGEQTHVVLTTLATSVLAWFVVLGAAW